MSNLFLSAFLIVGFAWIYHCYKNDKRAAALKAKADQPASPAPVTSSFAIEGQASASDIGLVITRAAQLERMLEDKFAKDLAAFRSASEDKLAGLGDKVKALDSSLPEEVKRDLWAIIKVRNMAAHEAILGEESVASYERRCDKVIKVLGFACQTISKESGMFGKLQGAERKKMFKTLLAINVVVVGGLILMFLTDASLRALAKEYAIPACIILAIIVMFAVIARNRNDDNDEDNDPDDDRSVINPFGISPFERNFLTHDDEH